MIPRARRLRNGRMGFQKWLALVFLIPLFSPLHAAQDSEKSYLTFCAFPAKALAIDPPPSSPERKKCNGGTAKIQGVVWECVNPQANSIDNVISGFRARLLPLLKQECNRECAARASGCVGDFKADPDCGRLYTDRESAINLGQNQMACKSSCGKGGGATAFAYCSTYNAAFQTNLPEMVKKQPANCYCRMGKSS